MKVRLQKKKSRMILIVALSFLLLLLAVLISISIGTIDMSLSEAFRVLFLGERYIDGEYGPIDIRNVVFNLRLPRILCGALVGAALAVSGAALQGIFRNPMASPSVIGISSGAAFGACLAMLLGFSIASGVFAIPAMAFIFAFITLFLVYFLARTRMGVPITMLLLSGIAVGAFFSGLVSLMQYYAGDKLEEVVFWLMGSLGSCGWDEFKMAVIPILVGSAILVILSKDLNILSLGDDQATNMGLNVERSRLVVLVASALVVAGAVSISGVIGFVGLVVPHIFRTMMGPDHRMLIPMSILGGAVFMIFMDTISRIIVSGGMPVGIITSLVGAPFFLWILRTRKKEVWGT